MIFKKFKWLILGIVLVLGGFGYVYRWDINDAWSAWSAPKLPEAHKYEPAQADINLNSDQNSPFEGGVATSQNYILVSSPPSSPKKIDPFENIGSLPLEVNLEIPFTTQAPYQNWDYPYQEACEEASAIMVDAFYKGEEGVIPIEKAKQAIDDFVAYENKALGYYKDTNATDLAKAVRGHFGYAEVIIKPVISINDIKRVVANGFPVILPAAGKLLNNPNFRNGGPLYHMLVVKGYTGNKIITNDPGTRRGADYVYSADVLMNAIHDWNGGDVENGEKIMIVIMPNP
ncbi:MAG: C39 family peptidase [Patescibacteria group bacterium]